MSRIWNDNRDLITTSKLVTNQEGLASFRSQTNQEFFGYFEGGNLLGFANVELDRTNYHIDQIATDTQHRRRGIADLLLGFIREQALEHKVSKLVLTVLVSNITAINFFLKNGFVINDYHVETEFLPKDIVLKDLEMEKEEDRKEFLRLVELQMEYDL